MTVISSALQLTRRHRFKVDSRQSHFVAVQNECRANQPGVTRMTNQQTKKEHEFADDLLEGAEAIAKFLYGPNASRRRVYHLSLNSRIPLFRLGSKLCARRSVLLEFCKSQENRALFATAASVAGERANTARGSAGEPPPTSS